MIGFTLGESTGVNYIKCTQTTFNGPVQAGVLILNVFSFKTLDLVVIVQVWIGIECTVTIDFLDHSANAYTPIIINVPQCTDASAGVASVVEIIFD